MFYLFHTFKIFGGKQDSFFTHALPKKGTCFSVRIRDERATPVGGVNWSFQTLFDSDRITKVPIGKKNIFRRMKGLRLLSGDQYCSSLVVELGSRTILTLI